MPAWASTTEAALFGASARRRRLWRRGEIGLWPAHALLAMTFSGWIATLAGWYTTEIGRQPWLVTGVLKTSEAVGTVPPAMVGFTFVAYVLVYLALLATYIGVLFLLARKAGQPTETPKRRPAVMGGQLLPAE